MLLFKCRIILIFAFIVSCVTTKEKFLSEDISQNTLEDTSSEGAEKYARLDEYLQKKPETSKDVEDLRLIFRAQKEEESNLFETAQKTWFQAAITSSGRLAEFTFNQWMRIYRKNSGVDISDAAFLKLVMSSTSDGQIFPFTVEKKINSEWALSDYLNSKKKSDESKADCLSLNKALSATEYQEAIALMCEKKLELARDKFKSTHLKFKGNPKFLHIAFESLVMYIDVQRSLGERESVADDYLMLAEALGNPLLTAESLNLNREEFYLRKLEVYLSAARARHLVNDLENAKIFVQEILDLTSQVNVKSGAPSHELLTQVAKYRLEAYHFLAFRISIEEKNYIQASALNTLALKESNITSEWKARLLWTAGLYEYLGENFSLAHKKWTYALNEVQDASVKPMLVFWLAKASLRLGNKEESRKFTAMLSKEFPLSFYAVVAANESNLSVSEDWSQPFKAALFKKSKTNAGVSINIVEMARSKDETSHLHKIDALIYAGDQKLAKLVMSDFEEKAERSRPKKLEDNLGIWVNYAKILNLSGQHLKAIDLISKLSTLHKDVGSAGFWSAYPMLIYEYFPSPHKRIFSSYQANQVELAKAIIRQESGFEVDLISPAGAVGLMQVMPALAQKIENRYLALRQDEVTEKLKIPTINADIGIRVLEKLKIKYKNPLSLIIAGYNAGEYAVSSWVERRGHVDPMMAIELIPYVETRNYVKNVWRNVDVYRILDKDK